jgi:hypothetical protein
MTFHLWRPTLRPAPPSPYRFIPMRGKTPSGRFMALAALVLAAGASPAAAQDFTPIRVGEAAHGSLRDADPALSQHGRFKVYRFNAVAGTRYVISMESEAFDSYLSVARLVGGITDVIKSDDDGGDRVNARLRFTPHEAGSYLLIAQSFGDDGTGDFTLKVDLAPQATTGAARPIQLGRSVSGTLADTDASLDEDESYYDTYTLSGRRGQRLVVEMRSDSFDTFLHFGRMAGGEFESIKTDDDGLEDTDSRLRVTLDEDGEYVIRANSVGAAETGPYTLEVRERPAAPPARAQALRLGAPVSGTLDDSDAVLDDEDVTYDLYTITGRRGQRLQVDMQSEAFDTYLDFGKMDDGWESLKTDDDGGEGTHSRLRITLTEDGTYQVRARSYGEGASGAYTISLREVAAPAPARPQAVRMGQSVSGTLAETDAVLEEEDVHYDLYTLTGRRGQRLVVEMRSDSFDTYLDLGRMRDGSWESLRTDDDGMGDGTHSRLRFTLPEDGEYMIRARSLGEGDTGPYTFQVNERAAGTPSAPRAVRAGEEVQGALADSDNELDDGSFYDVYTYAGTQGEELTITMTSDAFDTFLQFGRMVGGSFEEIATNDDGEDGTNSRLVVRLTQSGEYTIRANSLGGGRTGDYRVRVASSRDR